MSFDKNKLMNNIDSNRNKTLNLANNNPPIVYNQSLSTNYNQITNANTTSSVLVDSVLVDCVTTTSISATTSTSIVNSNHHNLSRKKQKFHHNKNLSLPSNALYSTTSNTSLNTLNLVNKSSTNQQQNYLQVTSTPISTFTTRNNTLTHFGSWNSSTLEIEQQQKPNQIVEITSIVNKNEFLDSNALNSPKSNFTFKRQCAIDFPANQLSHSVSATSSTESAITLAGGNSLEFKLSSSATNLPNRQNSFTNQLTIIDKIKNEKNKSDSDVNQLEQQASNLNFLTTLSNAKQQQQNKIKSELIANEKKVNSKKICMSSNQEDDQQLIKDQINSSYFGFTSNHRTHLYKSSTLNSDNKLDTSTTSTSSNQQQQQQKRTNVNLSSSSRNNFSNFFTRTSNQLLASLTGMKRIKRSMPAIILTPNNSLEDKTNLAEKKRRSTAQLISSSDSNSDANSCCSLPMDQQQSARPQTVSCEAVINLSGVGSNNTVTTSSSTISQPNQYSSLDDYRLRLIANYNEHNIPPAPPPSAASWFNAAATLHSTSNNARPYLQYRQRTDDGELRKRKQEQWLSTKQASIASQALSACEASTGFLSSLLPSGIAHGRTLHKSFDYAYHNPQATKITNQQLGSNQYANTVYHSTGSVPTTNIRSVNNNLITINNQHLKKAGSNEREAIKSRASLTTSEQMRVGGDKIKNRYQPNASRNVLRADTNTTTHSDSLKAAESYSEMSRKHRNSLYELKETARRKFSLIPKVSVCLMLISFILKSLSV